MFKKNKGNETDIKQLLKETGVKGFIIISEDDTQHTSIEMAGIMSLFDIYSIIDTLGKVIIDNGIVKDEKELMKKIIETRGQRKVKEVQQTTQVYSPNDLKERESDK